jgi:hypothetical protein
VKECDRDERWFITSIWLTSGTLNDASLLTTSTCSGVLVVEHHGASLVTKIGAPLIAFFLVVK